MITCCKHRRQHARDRTKHPVESELTEVHNVANHAGIQCFSCRQHGQRDREVVAGSLFGQRRRREIHGDLVPREQERAVGRSSFDPVGSLPACAVGQTDDPERRLPGAGEGLDLHDRAVDTVDGNTQRPSQSHAMSRRCSRSTTLPSTNTMPIRSTRTCRANRRCCDRYIRTRRCSRSIFACLTASTGRPK